MQPVNNTQKTTGVETKIVSTLSVKPAWVPEIARKTQSSNAVVRNTISKMFERGAVDITRSGFVLITGKQRK